MDQFEGPEHTKKSENSEPNNSDFLKRGWMVGSRWVGWNQNDVPIGSHVWYT